MKEWNFGGIVNGTGNRSTSRKLRTYGSTALVYLDRFTSFLIYTQSVGLIRQEISPSQGRYLHITKQTKNKRTQKSMSWARFEPTIAMFERATTVHALDRAGTVIGCRNYPTDNLSIISTTCSAQGMNPRFLGENSATRGLNINVVLTHNLVSHQCNLPLKNKKFHSSSRQVSAAKGHVYKDYINATRCLNTI
jgi:hypothetical protein